MKFLLPTHLPVWLTVLYLLVSFSDVSFAAEESEKSEDVDLAEIGRVFLAENALKSDVIVLHSGLQYKVLTKGTGTYHPVKSRYISLLYPPMCYYFC
jgi:FKBP-type peptidyl-prolyl cis-trans isomerase